MWSEPDLKAIRRSYARHILLSAGVQNKPLEEAFARVPREKFLGPPPWKVFTGAGYIETPDNERDWPYWDIVLGLIPERKINNGQPSGHALWLDFAAVRAGDHVVHIGAGTGYYTAILAHLTGARGRVTALECVSELAERAAGNLADLPHVQIEHAIDPSLGEADVIYVNAGATRPMDAWLDRLKPGGRLLVPLTTDQAFLANAPINLLGAMFLFTRDAAGFAARFVSPAAFIPGEGMRDANSELSLASALNSGRVQNVVRLHRGKAAAELTQERCWLRAPGWALESSE